MTARSSLTVVLAAGEGTRMRSSLPKVLHPVAGQPLLAHVLDAAPHGTGAALAVVIGPDHKAVADEVKRVRPDAATFVQAERLGTAHAVLAAREAIARGADDLLVAFGDTPLISAKTFARLRAPLARAQPLPCSASAPPTLTGYGRLLLEGDRLMAIREHADATEEERKVTLCNAGVMAFDGRRALEILDRIGNANSKGEYYLVDAVDHRQGNGIGGRRDRNQRGRSARHQHQGAARRSRSGDAGAAAQGGARCRRDADRAGDGLSRRRYHVRQRRHHRAVRGDRPRRHASPTAR